MLSVAEEFLRLLGKGPLVGVFLRQAVYCFWSARMSGSPIFL